MGALNPDRALGSILGLALGDAFGAPFEGGILERGLWALIGCSGGRRRWTDDTQMTIDVIESLVQCRHIDQDDLARRFAASYRWSRGYGPGTSRILKRIRQGQSWESSAKSVYRDGSYGNGGAMRAPAVGLFFAARGEEEVAKAADLAAAVTHAHPLAREGAILIAVASALTSIGIGRDEMIEALCARAWSPEFRSKLHRARAWLDSGITVAPRAVATELGNGIAAVESCVTAIYLALALGDRSFDELLAFAIDVGGDVDTIAAMACAIWGAARGVEALPRVRLERLEQRERLEALAASLASSDYGPC